MAKTGIGGIAGIWTDEHAAVKAAAKTRESGYTKFDAITPYPVHGMEEACGIPRSWIPYVTFVMGITGVRSERQQNQRRTHPRYDGITSNQGTRVRRRFSESLWNESSCRAHGASGLHSL